MKKATTTMLKALMMVGVTLATSTTLRAANWQFSSGPNAGTFISTQMYVSIQTGWNAVSAWTDRGDIAISSAMTPIGDGTFELRADLVPGGQYNYIFWLGGSTNTSASGFSATGRHVEPVPNSGSDAGTFYSLSTSSVLNAYVSSNAVVGYGSVAGDGRRLVRMPDVAAGTTVYIYNNFASTPTGVANTDVNPQENSVELSWRGALGYWGTGTGSPDILGGRIRIYMSSTVAGGTGVGGPYEFIAELSGTATTYTHTGLTTGASYFYVFVASDTYSGPSNPASQSIWANLTRDVSTPTAGSWQNNAANFNRNDLVAKPAAKVPTYFKVQKPDLDYILAHDGLVYLTPAEVDDPMYPYKIPAKLAVVYLPPKAN